MIRYTLSIPKPESHLFEVEIDVNDATGEYTDFIMPAWIPGSYKIRDFARFVQEFKARISGKPAVWRKIDKNTWRVFTRGARHVSVGYRVYAFELTVRSSHLDASHGYINGPSVFMYVEGRRGDSIELAIRKPRGWDIACGLDRRGDTLYASDYDRLADSPIEIGRFQRYRFKAGGKQHEFVIHGQGNYQARQLVVDTKKIVQAASQIFGEIPYDRYVFLLHTSNVPSGGLEHAYSTSLQTGMFDFKPRERYERVLNLIAHEYFHLWNVKRIVPANIIPFDYRREMYTSLLWVMEGVTSYYSPVILVRAKLLKPKDFLKQTAKMIKSYREKPGRLVQSLAESSHDAWIKHYQPHEHSINSYISYYEKGQLVGMLLDLELRARTNNRVSLDDVMRTLFEEFAKRGRGVGEGDVQAVVERLSGRSFETFFRDCVYGVKELDFERAFRLAGLSLKKKAAEGKAQQNGRKAYLGVVAQKLPEKAVISNVIYGSPAYHFGLSPADEVVAIDGFRVSPELWDKRMEEKRPGEKAVFTVFRGNLLQNIQVVLGGQVEFEYRLEPLAKTSALQRRIAEGWLRCRWADLK